MRNKRFPFVRMPFLFLPLLFCFCRSGGPGEVLNVAAASSSQFAMEEIIGEFTAQTGISCHLVTSSSGKLTAQIMEGAPYDVLVSADMKYPGKLARAGLTLNPPEIFTYGTLVLWSVLPEFNPDLQTLGREEIRYIAMANPDTAPYGRAAMEVLQNNDLERVLKDKLVYGESIGQVNQFIRSGSAELGFTALSVVSAPQFGNSAQWVVLDTTSYAPLAHGVVVIKRKDKKTRNAQRFRDFLFSKPAQEILRKYGYTVDESI